MEWSREAMTSLEAFGSMLGLRGVTSHSFCAPATWVPAISAPSDVLERYRKLLIVLIITGHFLLAHRMGRHIGACIFPWARFIYLTLSLVSYFLVLWASWCNFERTPLKFQLTQKMSLKTVHLTGFPSAPAPSFTFSIAPSALGQQLTSCRVLRPKK